MKQSGGYVLGIVDLLISTVGKLILSGSVGSLERWDARTGEQMGDYIEVSAYSDKIGLSNDGETIACGSASDDYVQKWETKSGKPVCDPMNWSKGEHILDEMEQTRLCGDQICDSDVRKDTYPFEMQCRAFSPDLKKIVLGLDNGIVAICERR